MRAMTPTAKTLETLEKQQDEFGGQWNPEKIMEKLGNGRNG